MPPLAPSARPARELVQLVDAMLAKEPADRPSLAAVRTVIKRLRVVEDPDDDRRRSADGAAADAVSRRAITRAAAAGTAAEPAGPESRRRKSELAADDARRSRDAERTATNRDASAIRATHELSAGLDARAARRAIATDRRARAAVVTAVASAPPVRHRRRCALDLDDRDRDRSADITLRQRDAARARVAARATEERVLEHAAKARVVGLAIAVEVAGHRRER